MQRIGFVTPSNLVARVADQIIAGRPVSHGYIGASLNPASTAGAHIAAVTHGSPASKASTAARSSSSQELVEKADAYTPGRTAALTVKRGHSTLTIMVTMAARPKTLPSG